MFREDRCKGRHKETNVGSEQTLITCTQQNAQTFAESSKVKKKQLMCQSQLDVETMFHSSTVSTAFVLTRKFQGFTSNFMIVL